MTATWRRLAGYEYAGMPLAEWWASWDDLAGWNRKVYASYVPDLRFEYGKVQAAPDSRNRRQDDRRRNG